MRDLASPTGNGLCFHWSAALALDLPGCDFMVGDIERVDDRIIHAWVEHRGKVLAPTLIEFLGGLMPLEREHYYAVNKAERVWRIPYRTLVPLLKDIGFPAHLRSARPLRRDRMQGRRFGEMILNLTDLTYRDDGKGGIVPDYGKPAMEAAVG